MFEFLAYTVADVMTPRPTTIRPDTTIEEVDRVLADQDFNGLPVVDADGTLVGMVTKLDLLKAFAFTPEHVVPPYDEIVARPAATVLTADPVTVTPDLPLTRVLQRMLETRHRSFPVVDGRRLVGMIAREDLMRALRMAVAGEHPTHPSGH
ncbi:MAG: CBS domain-containing protein [Candidatus Binatia bacterium]